METCRIYVSASSLNCLSSAVVWASLNDGFEDCRCKSEASHIILWDTYGLLKNVFEVYFRSRGKTLCWV